MEVLLEATGLHSYRGVRHVLRGVDLTIHRAEVIGLVGENGSGKSTLARVLSGALQPSSGTMTLAGEPYLPGSIPAARAAGVSIIEQDPETPDGLTVAEAMYRHGYLAGRPHHELLDPAGSVMARTRFTLDLDARVADLSPADRAVAEVLRVMAEEAQLIVLDEASSWLHDMDIVHLHEAVRHVTEQGGSLVYVAHRLEEVLAIADRVAVMREGLVRAVYETDRADPDAVVHSMLDRPRAALPTRDRASIGEARLTVRGLGVEGAVSGVDIDLHRGEALGVLGLRDSGAHELVEALAGVRPASASLVVLDGIDYPSIEVAADHIGYLPMAPSGLERKISDGLVAAGSDEHPELVRLREAVRNAHDLRLTTSDIRGPRSSLSGGDRQKVALAETVGGGRGVLVLSHPTRGIDLGVQARVYELVDAALRDGASVVFASNNVHELLARCDRVLVVHQGRAIALLRTDETHEDAVMDLALTGRSEPERTRRRSRLGS